MFPPEVIDYLKSYKWIIIFVISLVIAAYASVIFLGKNNPIEIEIEKVIEIETGQKINLTP